MDHYPHNVLFVFHISNKGIYFETRNHISGGEQTFKIININLVGTVYIKDRKTCVFGPQNCWKLIMFFSERIWQIFVTRFSKKAAFYLSAYSCLFVYLFKF